MTIYKHAYLVRRNTDVSGVAIYLAILPGGEYRWNERANATFFGSQSDAERAANLAQAKEYDRVTVVVADFGVTA